MTKFQLLKYFNLIYHKANDQISNGKVFQFNSSQSEISNVKVIQFNLS